VRILILRQFYPPEPTTLGPELAKTLQQKGHDVTVLTGFPNYPSGKLYPGYHLQPGMREEIEGIPVVRVPLYPDHSRSGMRRILNYVSFAISSSLLGPLLIHKPDAIFVYHPPLTVGIPAWILSRLWRVPFLYQVQDMWPETLAATGMLNNRRVINLVGRFADWVYGQANAICVISPGFRENLIQKGVSPAKIHLIPNWVDPETYYPAQPDPELAQDLGLDNRFNIMFAGNIGEAQGLETVLVAARALRHIPQVQFVFVGSGVALPRLQEEARDLTNVRFLGRYPAASMPALYALADVLLVHLKDDPLFRITIPHKILSYMASGKPILAAVAGDAADVVTEAKAGLACPPQDAQMLSDTVERMYHMEPEKLKEMGNRGREAARSIYSRDRLVGQIEAVLHSMVKGIRMPRHIAFTTEHSESQTESPKIARNSFYCRYIKPALDVSLALLAIILFVPIMSAVAIAVRLQLGTPVLFRQQRPGLHGKPFTILKFRTMSNACDADGRRLPDTERLTSLGRFLRAASLDELPELFNVLKGEMSLVGPRPLRIEYLPLYTAQQQRRHDVRPGITGWAQINGRNQLSWEAKFEMDIRYVEHYSFNLDLRILAMTVAQVLQRKGINAPGHATMPRFSGSENLEVGPDA